MKKVGEFYGVPVYVDPHAPKGTMYLINDKNVHLYTVDHRTRWQRFLDKLKRLIRVIKEITI